MADTGIKSSVSALTDANKAKTLGSPKVPAPIPAVTGKATAAVPSNKGTGGTIVGPLNETPGTREYYAAPEAYYSADGLMLIQVYPVKKITTTDANAATLVINFAEP